MKDPRRLLEGDASELELRLLTLAQHEQAPSEAPRRLAAQLGLPLSALGLPPLGSVAQPVGSASGMPAAGAGAAASVTTGWLHGMVGKLVLVGVLGALGGGAVVGVMSVGGEEGASVSSASPSALTSPSPSTTTSASASASASASVSGVGGAAGGLDREVAELARVRATLQAGRPEEALARLGSFEREHPDSVLTQEAWALRIEALLATRATAAARAEGERFLRGYPDSPHRARVQALLNAGRSLR